MMAGATGPVVNTYRLQLHRAFTFDDAAALAPQLAALGVTHLYLSPITQAAPGSTHGYDVTDPTRLDPELGGEDGFARLVEAVRGLGMGLVVDIVPNHMGIAASAGNEYWRDVLRHGPDSPHARIFDIDWSAHIEDGRPRVVLPVLGDAPEEVAARGELNVEVEAGELAYFDARFALSPESLEWWRVEGAARGDAAAILELLRRQHYRLAYWQSGKREVNYRRFFEVDDLIGVRTEDPDVYSLMHERVLALAREGLVDGLRVDHPDGLRNPARYLEWLQRDTPDGAYVIVEKILAEDETLPREWVTDGTSGYEVMNDFVRVLVDPGAEAAFTKTFATLTGASDPFEELASQCRADVLRGSLRRQVEALGTALHAATGGDIEESAFIEAFRALLAEFPVYRTYHTEDALDPRADAVVEEALRAARTRGFASPAALQAVATALAAPPAGDARDAVMRLQQIMPAIQAKGLEDRAFYRDRRLLALNEVGGDPGTFGSTVARFHERMAVAAQGWPRRMLATATHDHKRGEDARARLAALSELPQEWAATAARALEAMRALESDAERHVHASDLYLVLQTALATLPLGMVSTRPDPDLPGRLGAYLEKAMREAGERTTWLEPDEAYERAVIDLATRAFGREQSPVLDVVREHFEEVARTGAINALSQLVLKLGGPGVADTYQGNELWDLSLVDPDNRRQPDHDATADLLRSLEAALFDGEEGDAARARQVPELLANWRDGRIKLFVTARGLRVRRALAGTFLDGAYVPLEVRGTHADRVVAFARTGGGTSAIVVAPRLTRAINDAGAGEFWRPSWGDTTAVVDAALAGGAGWRDIFTGASHRGDAELRLADVLGAFPVAILLAA